MNIKFIVEVYAFYITENMNQNYNIIPCFVEMKIKTTNKIYGMSKYNLWFSIINTYCSSYSSQKNYV